MRFLSLRGTAVDDAGFEDFLKSKNASLLEDLDLSASKADQAGLITNRTAKMVSVSILYSNGNDYSVDIAKSLSSFLFLPRNTVLI